MASTSESTHTKKDNQSCHQLGYSFITVRFCRNLCKFPCHEAYLKCKPDHLNFLCPLWTTKGSSHFLFRHFFLWIFADQMLKPQTSTACYLTACLKGCAPTAEKRHGAKGGLNKPSVTPSSSHADALLGPLGATLEFEGYMLRLVSPQLCLCSELGLDPPP